MAYPSYYYGSPYRPLTPKQKKVLACIPLFGWYILGCDRLGKHMHDETVAIGERMWERAKSGTSIHPLGDPFKM